MLTPAEENQRDQEAVLGHVFAEYPDQLTLTELIRELSQGKAEFSESDPITSAAGLLRFEGRLVFVTFLGD